jgi:hypothetical protein
MAAATTAKEVAEKSKEILEFLGYAKPSGGPSLSDQINELRGGLNRLEAKVDSVLAELSALQRNEVNVWNMQRLEKYKHALVVAHAASDRLHYLVAADPTNVELRAEAASLTWEALFEFEFQTGLNLFAIHGPTPADERFHHLLTYGGYLNAIALRVAFISFEHGGRAMTKEPFKSELEARIARLRWLLTQISDVTVYRVEEPFWATHDRADEGTLIFPARHEGDANRAADANLVAYTRIVRDPNAGGICYGIQAWLQDHILFDREVAPENREYLEFYFAPGSVNCDVSELENAPLKGVNFHLANLVAELVSKRSASYGAAEIAAVADMLFNYTEYGRPTLPPPPAFSAWDYMMPFTALDSLGLHYTFRLTFVPDGDAVAGARVNVVPVTDARAWDEQRWLIPNADGLTPIVHVSSGLCLTPNAAGDEVALEVCDQESDQLWSRGTPFAVTPQPDALRHVATGLCLSATNAVHWTFVPPGGWIYANPGLRLQPCDGERLDQTWTRLNMSWVYGAPVSASKQMGLAPEGPPVPGATVSLVPRAIADGWQFSTAYGLFVHEGSQLCLTSTAGSADLTLDTCIGRSEQLWAKDIYGFIHHLSTGTCLAAEQHTWYDLGQLGQTFLSVDRLNLSPCAYGRGDQVWNDFNQVVPGGM